jgi:hypothetical protein
MADIEYRCVECDKPRVVSEFADATKLKCAACGGALKKPGDATATVAPEPDQEAVDANPITPAPVPVETPAPQGVSRLKLAKQQREQLEAKAELEAEPEPEKKKKKKNAEDEKQEFSADDLLRPKLELHPKTKVKRKGASHTILSLLVFIVIGGLTGYLRYGKELGWPGNEHIPVFVMQYMKYAWVAILALNTVVVLKAMSDNMFQGILCLLIPGWSLIYLLFISDNFYLRAIFFGCMVGLAQDGSAQLYDIAASGMQAVSNFINTGGGDVRRTDPTI